MAKREHAKQMVHMRLERSLLKAPDDFRFKHGFGSRTATIKWLLEWAPDQKPAVKGEE